MRIRLDNGDSNFETDGSDLLAAGITDFSLIGGVQEISFTNDDTNVQVSNSGTDSKKFWISILTTSNASSQNPNNFCLIFDPDADALVEGKTPDF